MMCKGVSLFPQCGKLLKTMCRSQGKYFIQNWSYPSENWLIPCFVTHAILEKLFIFRDHSTRTYLPSKSCHLSRLNRPTRPYLPSMQNLESKTVQRYLDGSCSLFAPNSRIKKIHVHWGHVRIMFLSYINEFRGCGKWLFYLMRNIKNALPLK